MHASLTIACLMVSATALNACPDGKCKSGPVEAQTVSTEAREPWAEENGETRPARPDADMKAVLDALAALDPKPIVNLTPEQARRQPTPAAAVLRVMKDRGLDTKPIAMADVDEDEVDVDDGPDVRVRIYKPLGFKPGGAALVYFHGGGFVIADLDTYDASARALADATDALVVSVDYRRAPEHKFPAAHDDAYRATQWVFAHAGELGIDAGKVVVVGESAGGNLATAVCLMAKDRGGRMPAHQVLIYPMTSGGTLLASYETYADAKPLDRGMMQWFYKHTMSSPTDLENKYLAPLKAGPEALRDLPPATVVTAEIDPLRSDGTEYVARLKSAGVPVSHRHFEGVTHEFFGMAPVVAKAREAQQFVAADLARALTAGVAGERQEPKK